MSVNEYDRRRTFGDGKTDSDDEIFKTTRIDVFDITEKTLSYGDRSQIFPTAKSRQADDPQQKYSEYALLIRRKIDKDDKPQQTLVEFQSSTLCACIRELLSDYPDLNLNATPIVFEKPYVALFHKRKEIREYMLDRRRTEKEKKHLNVLKDFMVKNLAEAEAIDTHMVQHGVITFQWLWLLFSPGDWILYRDQEYDECYRFFESYNRLNMYNEPEFVVKAWGWDYNGKLFGPSLREFVIPQFVGNRGIQQLDIVPTKFLGEEEWGRISKELVKRGHEWKRCARFSHFEYNGENSSDE